MKTKKDILIVDDEEIVRRMLGSYFKPYYNVLTAAHAFEALELLFGIHREKFPLEFDELERFLKNQTRPGIKIKDQAAPLKFTPALIIADIKMPFINGFQLIHFLRPFINNVPVFLITGYDVELSENEIKQLEINEVLSKPFSPSILLQKVQEVLED